MPKVLPEYLEQRRQQILDAAATCFSRRGFHQTTMQDICEQAELSPGALYRYFRSKEDIIEAMCTRGQQDDADAIQAILDQHDTLDAFDTLVDTFLGSEKGREACALNLELIAESSRNPAIGESILQSRRTISSPMLSYIEKAQDRGEIDPRLDPLAVSRVMISLYHGLIIQQMAEPDLDTAAYCDAVKSLFHGEYWLGRKTETPSPADAVLRH